MPSEEEDAITLSIDVFSIHDHVAHRIVDVHDFEGGDNAPSAEGTSCCEYDALQDHRQLDANLLLLGWEGKHL